MESATDKTLRCGGGSHIDGDIGRSRLNFVVAGKLGPGEPKSRDVVL
jgi:hypothetical protein